MHARQAPDFHFSQCLLCDLLHLTGSPAFILLALLTKLPSMPKIATILTSRSLWLFFPVSPFKVANASYLLSFLSWIKSRSLTASISDTYVFASNVVKGFLKESGELAYNVTTSSSSSSMAAPITANSLKIPVISYPSASFRAPPSSSLTWFNCLLRLRLLFPVNFEIHGVFQQIWRRHGSTASSILTSALFLRLTNMEYLSATVWRGSISGLLANSHKPSFTRIMRHWTFQVS